MHLCDLSQCYNNPVTGISVLILNSCFLDKNIDLIIQW